jgi:hypothetical protein
MKYASQDIINKICILVGILISIYIIKPNILFKPNGKVRDYGVGYDYDGYRKSLYSMQTLIIILAVIIYLY